MEVLHFVIAFFGKRNITAFSLQLVSVVSGCTHCVFEGRSHGYRFEVYVCTLHSLTSPPPGAESTARPPRVKLPWRGWDAEQTARASDFASSYLGLERLTKTNSSGLMIRGESRTCAAACIQLTDRENRITLPPQVAGSSVYKSSDLSSDSCLLQLFKCLRTFIRYMRVNTHA